MPQDSSNKKRESGDQFHYANISQNLQPESGPLLLISEPALPANSGPQQEGLLAQPHLPPFRVEATSPATRNLTPACKHPSELSSPSTTLHGQEAIDIKYSHSFPYPICVCGYQKCTHGNKKKIKCRHTHLASLLGWVTFCNLDLKKKKFPKQ